MKDRLERGPFAVDIQLGQFGVDALNLEIQVVTQSRSPHLLQGQGHAGQGVIVIGLGQGLGNVLNGLIDIHRLALGMLRPLYALNGGQLRADCCRFRRHGLTTAEGQGDSCD